MTHTRAKTVEPEAFVVTCQAFFYVSNQLAELNKDSTSGDEQCMNASDHQEQRRCQHRLLARLNHDRSLLLLLRLLLHAVPAEERLHACRGGVRDRAYLVRAIDHDDKRCQKSAVPVVHYR